MNLTISTSLPIAPMHRISFKADKGGDNPVRRDGYTGNVETDNPDKKGIPYDSHLHDSQRSNSDKAAAALGYSIFAAMAIAGFMTDMNEYNEKTSTPQDTVSTEIPHIKRNVPERYDSVYKSFINESTDGTIVDFFSKAIPKQESSSDAEAEPEE